MLQLKAEDLPLHTIDPLMFLELMKEALTAHTDVPRWGKLKDTPSPFFLREPYYVDGYKFQFCDIASMGFLSEAYLDIRYETGEGYADYVQLSDLVEQGKASPEQLEVWQALQEIREQLRGMEYLTQGMEQYRDRVIGGIDFSRLYTMFQSVTDLDYWDYSPGIDVVSLEEIPQE